MCNRWILLPLVAAMMLPVSGFSATGRVVLASPDSLIEQAGQWLPARLGQEVDISAASTGANGRLQLHMSDGALVALPPASKVQFTQGASATVTLLQGGLRLTTPRPDAYWNVLALDRQIRASGYLKLQVCAQSCALAAGVYGRGHGGEAVVEYSGGRSVLKEKIFRLTASGTRPDVLVRAPTLLDDASDFAQAELAKQALTKRLLSGIEAFRANDFSIAKTELEGVQAENPSETVVSYYLGLIALEKQDNAQALLLLQKYLKEDPQAAIEREVPKTITLLSTHQLQEEVASALVQEKSLAAAPPEPNSIAVQTFASRGDPIYRVMAKGIAAVVIADLTQVPGLKVLEREKMQQLLAEMRLGDSGLTDESSAVRSGRLMRAEKVIVGSFGAQ